MNRCVAGLLTVVLCVFAMNVASATKYDRYGVPMVERSVTVNQLSEVLDEAEEELNAFARTLKGVGYTGEILWDGSIGGQKTYVVLGLNTTGEVAEEMLRTAGTKLEESVVELPENLENAFINSPAKTGREIGSDARADWRAAADFCSAQMDRAGRDLRVHRAYGLPMAAGRTFVAAAGGLYFLVVELPVEVAIDLTKGLLRSAWHLVGDPVTGLLALGCAGAVAVYGAASSLAGAAVQASLTVIAATLEGINVLVTAPRKLVKVLF